MPDISKFSGAMSRFLILIAIASSLSIFWLFFRPAVYFPISHAHFFPFEKNLVGAKLILGEDINRYTQVHWENPLIKKLKAADYPFIEKEFGTSEIQVEENPELKLFLFRKHGDIHTAVADIYTFDSTNTKNQHVSFQKDSSGNRLEDIRWFGSGFLLRRYQPDYYYNREQDYFYDLKEDKTTPIQDDGQYKLKVGIESLFSHPKNLNYLLETYCLSDVCNYGGCHCVQWGVSLITPTKSTKILSFYRATVPSRAELRIGWDDDNFYVKTAKSSVDWAYGKSEQELAQDRMNVDRAESGDVMYIIPLKNLEKI